MDIDIEDKNTRLYEAELHPSLFSGPDPNLAINEFKTTMDDDLTTLGCRTLIHKKSHTATCFKYSQQKNTEKKCRFGFPREIVHESSIDTQTGEILLCRKDSWINNYNPWITMACRSNNDIQFIGSGAAALARIYYITNYITKSDLTTYNAYAMGAAAIESDSDSQNSLTNNNQLFVIKEKFEELVDFWIQNLNPKCQESSILSKERIEKTIQILNGNTKPTKIMKK